MVNQTAVLAGRADMRAGLLRARVVPTQGRWPQALRRDAGARGTRRAPARLRPPVVQADGVLCQALWIDGARAARAGIGNS